MWVVDQVYSDVILFKAPQSSEVRVIIGNKFTKMITGNLNSKFFL